MIGVDWMYYQFHCWNSHLTIRVIISASMLTISKKGQKYFCNWVQEIVVCWNNCSGNPQEKCLNCNLIFSQVIKVEKGQQVKGFWSQGRKKGTKGKVFENEAVGRGWEMFPEVPFFLPRLQNVYELPFFFQPRCLGINQITRESFSP